MSKEKKETKTNEGKIIILIMIMFFFSGISYSFVSAAPPIATVTGGYSIAVPQSDIAQIGQDFNFQFHIYNISNGIPINSGVSCEFHLYNSTGDHLYSSEISAPDPVDIYDYEFFVTGGNFSVPNLYYYYIACNSSNLGGFSTDSFLVTPTGIIPTTFQGIVDFLIWIVAFAILIGLLILGIKLPSKNDTNEMTGYVIAVSNMKYLKMLCLVFAYLTALFIAYATWQLAYAYLALPVFTTIFQDIFTAMAIIIIPLFPVTIFILFANIIRDNKIQDFLAKGLEVKG